MGKSTINHPMFHSFLYVYQAGYNPPSAARRSLQSRRPWQVFGLGSAASAGREVPQCHRVGRGQGASGTDDLLGEKSSIFMEFFFGII